MASIVAAYFILSLPHCVHTRFIHEGSHCPRRTKKGVFSDLRFDSAVPNAAVQGRLLTYSNPDQWIDYSLASHRLANLVASARGWQCHGRLCNDSLGPVQRFLPYASIAVLASPFHFAWYS